MVGFIEQRLPQVVERGSSGGPRFMTRISTGEGGYEQRLQRWEQARAEYDISYGLSSIKSDPKRTFYIQQIINHFRVCAGQAFAFRFRDWADYEMTRDLIAMTDATKTEYQIIKTYRLGNFAHDRIISKPIAETVKLWVANTEFTRVDSSPATQQFSVDETTGIVTLNVADLATSDRIEVECSFDVPVRFATDVLSVVVNHASGFGVAEIPNITLVEVRL